MPFNINSNLASHCIYSLAIYLKNKNLKTLNYETYYFIKLYK